MLGNLIPSPYRLLAKVLATIAILGSVAGYIWYLHSENATLTAQKLLLVSELSQAVDANQSNLKTINTLHKEAAESAALAERYNNQANNSDKVNDQTKHDLSNRPEAGDHVSPYIGNVFDRLRSIQQSEGTGQN